MIKSIKTILLLVLLGAFVLSLDGCSNAEMAQWTALGSDAHIVCYSGTLVTYDGYSSGKVSTEHGSDGWFFKDKKTGHLMRISGACVIEN